MNRISIARYFNEIEKYTVSDFGRALEAVDEIEKINNWCATKLTPGGYRYKINGKSRYIEIDDESEATLFKLTFDL